MGHLSLHLGDIGMPVSETYLSSIEATAGMTYFRAGGVPQLHWSPLRQASQQQRRWPANEIVGVPQGS
jgi:hypothetical protein